MSAPNKGTILVAIDGSRNSLVAAGVGARMARLLDAHLGLIHVLDEPVVSFWSGVETRMKEERRNQAEVTLGEMTDRIREICDVVPEFYIVEGTPEVEILRTVKADPQIMMLVTGSHGVATEKKSHLRLRRSGNHLGTRLSEALPVPILVVPPDIPESHICSAMAEYRASYDDASD
ncbi:MAG TPA: universal stress protein [Gammaproteobacteria bacterium]|nr:universal stress protein [Gammaproteobacteria bacterium]